MFGSYQGTASAVPKRLPVICHPDQPLPEGRRAEALSEVEGPKEAALAAGPRASGGTCFRPGNQK